MINVGLLGAGRIGQVHAVNIAGHRDTTLVAISDINADAANELANQHGASVQRSEEIISNDQKDIQLFFAVMLSIKRSKSSFYFSDFCFRKLMFLYKTIYSFHYL